MYYAKTQCLRKQRRVHRERMNCHFSGAKVLFLDSTVHSCSYISHALAHGDALIFMF